MLITSLHFSFKADKQQQVRCVTEKVVETLVDTLSDQQQTETKPKKISKYYSYSRYNINSTTLIRFFPLK